MVGNQIADGRKLIDRLAGDGFDVSAAFWMHTVDDDEWFLYIVSNEVGRAATSPYMAVIQAVNDLGELDFQATDVKLIDPGKPAAKAFLGYLRNYPPSRVTRLSRYRLGELYVHDSYLYPVGYAPVPEPTSHRSC